MCHNNWGPYVIWKDVWIGKSVSTLDYLKQNIKRVHFVTSLIKWKCQELFTSADSIFASQWISHPAIWKWCVKQLFRQFVQNSQKSTCAGVPFEHFWRLDNSNFIIKEVGHRCCPETFAKFFRTVLLYLCAAASGVCTILAIVIKTFKRGFFICLRCRYGCWTKIRNSRN